VFETASGPWCIAVFLEAAAAVGARRGEVLALRWSDTKDDRATTTEAHRKHQDEFRIQFGPDYRGDLDLIFSTPDGTPLKPDSISAAVSRKAPTFTPCATRTHHICLLVACRCRLLPRGADDFWRKTMTVIARPVLLHGPVFQFPAQVDNAFPSARPSRT
jgi:integrase